MPGGVASPCGSAARGGSASRSRRAGSTQDPSRKVSRHVSRTHGFFVSAFGLLRHVLLRAGTAGADLNVDVHSAFRHERRRRDLAGRARPRRRRASRHRRPRDGHRQRPHALRSHGGVRSAGRRGRSARSGEARRRSAAARLGTERGSLPRLLPRVRPCRARPKALTRASSTSPARTKTARRRTPRGPAPPTRSAISWSAPPRAEGSGRWATSAAEGAALRNAAPQITPFSLCTSFLIRCTCPRPRPFTSQPSSK